MRILFGLISLIIAFRVEATHAQVGTPPQPDLKWFADGVLAALRDETPGVPAAAIVLPEVDNALGQLELDDPAKARMVADAVLKRLDDTEDGYGGVVQGIAARILGRLNVGVEQKNIIIAALIKRIQSDNVAPTAGIGLQFFVKMEAARALGQVGSLTDKQNEIITVALVKRLEETTDDIGGFLGGAAAEALGRIKTRDLQERSYITSLLLKHAGNAAKNPFGRESAIQALEKIGSSGEPSLRDDIVAGLTQIGGLENDVTGTVRIALAKAIVKVGRTDQGPNGSIALAAAALKDLNLGPSTSEGMIADIRILGSIQLSDPKLRGSVITALLRALATTRNNPQFSSIRDASAEALGKITIDDPAVNNAVVSALLDAAKESSDNSPVSERYKAVLTLGQIRPTDTDQRDAVLSFLLGVVGEKSTKSGFNEVRAAAATALGQIKIDEPESRDVVIATLLENLNEQFDSNSSFLRAAAQTLGKIKPANPAQKEAIVSTLLNRLGDEQYAVPGALLSFGPLSPDQLLVILRSMHNDAYNAKRTAYWRARALAFAGVVTPPEASWVFLQFLARQKDTAVPWQQTDGKPAVAIDYLRQLDDHWAGITGSDGLELEAARSTVNLVEHACPSTAQKAEGDWSDKLLQALRQESLSTLNWISGSMRSDSAHRCWTNQDRQTLSSLQKHLQKEAKLETYASRLSQQISADRAAPTFGLMIVGYVAWALPCLLLIAVFPYFPLVRRIFLFNEKIRNFVSLGWLPIFLHSSRFLRNRLLQPFRDDLLADARLAELDVAYWFPHSKVTNKDGTRTPIRDAIHDVEGNILLIGESGLGKSTYLRVLASRSSRTLVFLNAQACDKGIFEAISKKTKGVQDTNFFKSMVYSRDLVVIIDGLNEVSADTRAIIISFANEFRKADLLIATQPIESIDAKRSPLTDAVAYEICPLDDSDIEQFLISRPVRDTVGHPVRGSDYDNAARRFVSSYIGASETPDEQASARLILSNPLDLTYAAELLAMGQLPRPTELIGQAFELACVTYEKRTKRSFPKLAFAQKAVELRLNDRNWLYSDEHPNEQPELRQFRLMVPRTLYGKDGKEAVGLYFRHDKIWDFFMQMAFFDNDELQLSHLDDPRFRGVYLLFAQTADLETARRLRDIVVTRAADTLDHTLSDEFVRRLASRDHAGGRVRAPPNRGGARRAR
jgi:hypothetical protein